MESKYYVDCEDGGAILLNSSKDSKKLLELLKLEANKDVMDLEDNDCLIMGYGEGPFPGLSYYGAPDYLMNLISKNNLNLNVLYLQMSDPSFGFSENGKKAAEISCKYCQDFSGLPKLLDKQGTTEKFILLANKYEEMSRFIEWLNEGRVEEDFLEKITEEEKNTIKFVVDFYYGALGIDGLDYIEDKIIGYDVIFYSNAHQ